MTGAVENLWAYLNRNSKHENKDESQSPKEKEITESPKNIKSHSPNSLFKSQINSRNKNSPNLEALKSPGITALALAGLNNEESKRKKDLNFVKIVSSIEKSHSSSAIEGKCLKKIEDQFDSLHVQEKMAFGSKWFNTTEDLPRLCTQNKVDDSNKGI